MIPKEKFNKKFFLSGPYYKDYRKLLGKWVAPVAKRIYQILKNKSSAKILDIGCSFGNLLAELQNKYHFQVSGLECSSYAIQQSEPSVKAKIKKGSILKPPFGKNSFDVVVCFDVINYLTSEETSKAIKKLINLSRDYIFFNSIYRYSCDASQKHNPDHLRVTVLSKKEYIDIFFRNGAKLVKNFYEENGGNILVFKKK